MSDVVAVTGRELARPEPPRPDQLPPGWGVTRFNIAIEALGYVVCSFELVHGPTGKAVELEWVAAPANYDWLRGFLTIIETMPSGLRLSAEEWRRW